MLWFTLILGVVSRKVSGEEFVVGYVTGSQRRPGDLEYVRPGLTISGAISLAVDELNAGTFGQKGHYLKFVVAETYGEEKTSIRQVATLWTQNISAYIGPQETCVHEGRMAAAFNLPMISYVSYPCRLIKFSSVIVVKIKHFICSKVMTVQFHI